MQIKVTLGNLLIAHFPLHSASTVALVSSRSSSTSLRRVGTLGPISTNLTPKTVFFGF
jgi:hypothetical protein